MFKKILTKPFGLTSFLSPSVPDDCSDYKNCILQTFLCLRDLSILSHLRNFFPCDMNITPGVYKLSKSFANKWDKFPRPNPSLAEIKGNCDNNF